MWFHSRRHLSHQNLLKCFLWFYWIPDASLFLLLVSLEVQMKIQSAQPTGSSDARVLTCIPRLSLVPIMATGNPAAGKGAFPVQCEEASDTRGQLAAFPLPPSLKWGLGPQLGTAAPPAVSAGPPISRQAKQCGLGQPGSGVGPAPSHRG